MPSIPEWFRGPGRYVNVPVPDLGHPRVAAGVIGRNGLDPNCDGPGLVSARSGTGTGTFTFT
jgi:hypothetical protein